MENNIVKICADAFSHHIDELYHQGRIEDQSRPGRVEEPITGLFYLDEDKDAAAGATDLTPRAQAAKARFAIEGPPWAQPLPLHWEKIGRLPQIGELVEAGILAQDYYNGRLELAANFIVSWCACKFNRSIHRTLALSEA